MLILSNASAASYVEKACAVASVTMFFESIWYRLLMTRNRHETKLKQFLIASSTFWVTTWKLLSTMHSVCIPQRPAPPPPLSSSSFVASILYTVSFSSLRRTFTSLLTTSFFRWSLVRQTDYLLYEGVLKRVFPQLCTMHDGYATAWSLTYYGYSMLDFT